MTFTKIVQLADKFRRRFTFDWIEVDPPTWDWPERVTQSKENHE